MSQEPRHGARLCVVCGSLLHGDPDDQSDPWCGPVCGECHRAREFDETLWERDLAEGHYGDHGDPW
jgi:hypothetical protein